MPTPAPDNTALLALANALAPYLQQGAYKAATGTPVNPYLHGPGGLFGVSGLERDVISTRIAPQGLAGRLPAYADTKMYPLFAYISGYQDTSGSNATTVCSTPKTAGAMKNCLQTAEFGRYSFQTREMEINRVGQVNDRGEFLDLQVLNDPLVDELGGAIWPSLPQQSQILAGRELVARMLEVGVAFQNTLVRQVYTGNPTNNSAGGGYKEFPGLDILIGTAKYDALTGTACPSLASDIKSLNSGNISTTLSTTNDIVNVMTYMARYLRWNADHMNFGETKWVITMRKDLFYELTALWPCSYLTYRCQFRATDGTIHLNVDAAEQVRMRDAMRAGRYLLIDGEQYEVVLDDGIIEENRSAAPTVIPIGGYRSDIYFIPMTVRGNIPVTYWQYFDYNAGNGTMSAVQDSRIQQFWSDGGRYMWVSEFTRWCVLMTSKIEPRIILRTPQLAGRIQDVVYVPLQHMRDALPSDYYFVDGGVSTARAAPSYYSDWHVPA